MKVLDRPKTVSNGTIEIPEHHRAHVSLYQRVPVSLAALPVDCESQSEFIELVATSIAHGSWAHLLRLNATLIDIPGTLRQLLLSVNQHGGKIVMMDSGSIEGVFHEVEIIADFQPLFSSFKAHEPKPDLDRFNEYVEGLIQADCYDALAYQRARPLRVAYMEALRAAHNRLRDTRPQEAAEGNSHFANNSILLPQKLIDHIANRLGRNTDNIDGLQYVVTSDTEERVIRIYFLPDEGVFCWCAVGFDDKPGAMALLAKGLAEQGINISISLRRNNGPGGLTWYVVLLRKPEWAFDNGHSRRRLANVQNEVREAFDFDKIGLKNGVVHFDESKYLRAAQAANEAGTTSRDNKRVVTPRVHWIKSRKETLKQVVPKIGDMPRDRKVARRKYLLLESGIDKVERLTGRSEVKIFLSIALDKNLDNLREAAEEICLKQNCRIDIVTAEERQNLIKSDIKRRIERCSFFVGVWTHSKHDHGGDGARPSPWLPWETAIAYTAGVKFRICVESGVELVDYLPYKELFAYRFQQGQVDSFKEAFDQALQSLRFASFWTKETFDRSNRIFFARETGFS